MAYSKSTFNDILLSVSYRYGEISVPTNGIENRKYWVNKGIEYCVEKLKMRKSVPVTVLNGVCSLDAVLTDPALDFKAISKLVDSNGIEYRVVTIEEYAKQPSDKICSISGNHITGNILNVKTDGDYTLFYYFYPEKISNDDDICIIQDPEAVVSYAYAQLRLSETDPIGDAQRNLDECNERIRNMAADMSINEGDLSFKVMF